MRRVETAVNKIIEDIEGKKVLEIACGCAEFSVEAAKFAKTVCAVDLDESRLPENIGEYKNIHFYKMDATAMEFEDESFDTTVLYNAVGHLEKLLDKAVFEGLRVLCNGGCLYIVSSSKMDKFVIKTMLLPLLEEKKMNFSLEEDKIFTWVKITK